jgi:hypothetical protein
LNSNEGKTGRLNLPFLWRELFYKYAALPSAIGQTRFLTRPGDFQAGIRAEERFLNAFSNPVGSMAGQWPG